MRKTIILKASAAPLAMGLALAATPAFAQDEEAPAADAPSDVIVVTGSRVSNPNLELSSPVTFVSSEELELRQTNTAESFLRELPAAVPSIGSAVNNGNGGASFVNLRGIGSNRNLVLLDGRRVVPSGTGGVVDLNNIPLAVIERTDVLTGGATTTYGADAISGVVNFITKKDFAGVDLTASQQVTEEGDGEIFRVDLTIGANFDDGRGNAVLAIGYQNQDEVLQGDRPFSETAIDSFDGTVTGSFNTVPANLLFGAQGPGGTGTTLFAQIDPTDPSGLAPPNGGAGPFNFNPFNIFQTPFERFNIYGSANYEVTDNIEVFAQTVFSRQSVETIIAPGGSFFNTYALNLNNPFLSAGIQQGLCGALALTAAECTAAITTTDGEFLADGSTNPDFRVANGLITRRSVEAGTRNSVFTTTIFNIAGGLRGSLTDNIDWEVSGTYGESERIQSQTGFARFSTLQDSLIAVDDGTGPRCVVSLQAGTNPGAGCVPLNIFGGLGTMNQDGIDSVFGFTQRVSTTSTIGTLQGLLTGDLGFAIAESPISFAAGAEYREFTAGIEPDAASQTPGEVVGGGGATPVINGSYDVIDLFGELAIPLIEGASFAESLVLELGGRYSDYSTAGTEFTWKVGGTWEITPSFLVRGNYQRSSRAPNIGELFAPVTTGLANLATDPCAGANPVGNAALTAVCVAQGAPAGQIGSILQPIAGQINITGGGNPDLGVETADTWTVGAVWQPSFANLSVSIDYFNIKVEDAVSSPAVGDVINGCFFDGNLDFGSNVFCRLIERSQTTGALSGAPNELRGVILQSSNLGLIETDGIDLSARYRTPLTDSIDLSLSFDGTWTNENVFTAFPGAFARDCIGFYSVNCGSIQPEFSFTQRTTLSFDNGFSASVRWRFLSSTEQEPDDVINNGIALQGPAPALGGETVDFANTPAEHYFDLTLRAEVTENLTVTGTVTNLFDNDPHVVGFNIGSTAFNSGNIYPSTYDALGRRYAVSANLRF